MSRLRALPPGIAAVGASPTVDFVTTLLALLGLERPAAVFSSTWTSEECVSRHALLGRHIEIDASGEVAREWPGETRALCPLTRLILFTTGSTGQPRAVQLSEHNIRSNSRAVADALDFDHAKSQMLFLPLSYSFGLLGQLLPALDRGMQTEIVDRLIDAVEALVSGTVEGMISGVPPHFETILRALPPGHTCNRLTHVVTAGAYSSPDLRQRLHRAFPSAMIYNNYGQTEASPRILSFKSSHPLFYTPATGYPVPGLRVKCSESGELLVSGPQVMLGYLGHPDGPRDTVTGGWLATGDLAQVAADGLVTVLGRADDLVNVGGERTSASEIESALRRVSGVRDAAVLVVPDTLYGAAFVAYVETGDAGITEAEILNDLRRHVSGHRIPRAFHLIDALPVNAYGKIDRAALTAMARSRIAS
jgi:long-chain acyl-CoA synthetase